MMIGDVCPTLRPCQYRSERTWGMCVFAAVSDHYAGADASRESMATGSLSGTMQRDTAMPIPPSDTAVAAPSAAEVSLLHRQPSVVSREMMLSPPLGLAPHQHQHPAVFGRPPPPLPPPRFPGNSAV